MDKPPFNRDEYLKQYRLQNKEKLKQQRKIRYEQKKDEMLQYAKEYREANPEYASNWYHKNKEHVKIKTKAYQQATKPARLKREAEYRKERKLNDPLYKAKQSARDNVYKTFKKNGYKKDSKTEELLGCTFEEFKQHIESQFEPWMSWDNYGGKKPSTINESWDIDHIIPVSSAITLEDVKRLSHYTNLRPLCSYTNRFIKRDNI